jgi:TolA-binding protein
MSACLVLVPLFFMSAQVQADELHGFILPDDGPRYTNVPDGPDKTLFLEGVTATQQERYREAEHTFTALLKNYPSSPLIMASRAFLADLIAKKGTDRHRRLAIEAYSVLIRDDPSSSNTARARWRMGDLYAQGHWLVEAKALYEQVLAQAPKESARALVGLGLVLLDSSQWKEAQHAFEQVRTRTDDTRLTMTASFGLAESLYRQQQWEPAQSVYESGMRQWPAEINLQPQMLIYLADVKSHLNKEPEARGLLEKFYNLYPTRPEASSVLIQIGDSWRQVSRTDRAKTLYAAVIHQYVGSPQEAMARMRLAELDKESRAQEPKPGPQLGIEALFEGRRSAESDSREQEVMFEQTAQTYAGTKLGSEALFHLGEHFESLDRRLEAVEVYRRLSDRKGQVADDPWPATGGGRVVQLLRPWMESALNMHDDLTAVNLFYRHGAFGAELYAAQPLLLQIAEAHYRMGFFPQAVKLYHALVKPSSPPALRERAMVGLGRTYLDQRDFPAARRVFERFLLQFPASPTKPTVLETLAETLQQQGDWSGVMRICRLWLRHEASHPILERQRIRLLLARAQAESRQSRQALDTLAHALPVKGDSVRGGSLQYADQLYLAQEYDRAAEQYARAIQGSMSSSDGEWARLQLAKVRRTQKRYDEARALLHEVQSITTDDLVARISAALLADLPETKKKAGG